MASESTAARLQTQDGNGQYLRVLGPCQPLLQRAHFRPAILLLAPAAAGGSSPAGGPVASPLAASPPSLCREGRFTRGACAKHMHSCGCAVPALRQCWARRGASGS